jgi:polysaccharide biosynthesis transport protein
VQPRPFKWGVLGFLIALILGPATALLREALDTRVRGADEISKLLRQPLLGRIPSPAKRMRADSRLAMLGEPNGPAAEGFRVLRTNLDFVSLDHARKVVMVTSPLPGDGKSTTAANLAVAVARGGRRCVLVEFDLRRPVLKEMLDLQSDGGLTAVALGVHDLDEAIELLPISDPPDDDSGRGTSRNGSNGHAHVKTLEVLPAGPLPPDPGEFVTTAAVLAIIEALRARADLVIVDAPPLLGVGDAVSLAPLVDGIILVTRAGNTRRASLREAHRILEQLPVPKLGFVLTGADREDSYAYDGYRYYYRQSSPGSSKVPEIAGR